MTPFEQGYAAFLAGHQLLDNPFDGETTPHSRKRWDEGWKKARGDRK
jgi:ribosome modulation factor